MQKNLDAFKKRIEEHSSVDNGVKFKMPSSIKTGTEASKNDRQRSNLDEEGEDKYVPRNLPDTYLLGMVHGHFLYTNKQNSHRWMNAIEKFKTEAVASYRVIRARSRTSKQGEKFSKQDEKIIKVALIDDGVNPGKLTVKDCVKGGWPLDAVTVAGTASAYYNSTEGHGTAMARLINFVCPLAHLYIAKLEKDAPKPYTSVIQMATKVSYWLHTFDFIHANDV